MLKRHVNSFYLKYKIVNKLFLEDIFITYHQVNWYGDYKNKTFINYNSHTINTI